MILLFYTKSKREYHNSKILLPNTIPNTNDWLITVIEIKDNLRLFSLHLKKNGLVSFFSLFKKNDSFFLLGNTLTSTFYVTCYERQN